MKTKGFVLFSSLMALSLVVGLACSFGSSNTPVPPTPIVANPNPQQPKPTEPQANPQQPEPTQSGPTQPPASGGWVTFTDQNNLYTVQVPDDWVYKQVTGDNYYIDQFKSPDEQALVENITYDDGTPFTGSQNGRFALDLLNRFYSNTSEVGDIRVSSDQLMPDGSERLEWTSKSGGYSGASYFEIRGSDHTTFLMITIEWVNSAQDQYLDLLNQVIESYRLP